MYGGEVATKAPGDTKITDGKELREIRIRRLDDGTFVLCAEFEGRSKSGMHSYERKESSYATPKAVADALVNDFLKANISTRASKKNLVMRDKN